MQRIKLIKTISMDVVLFTLLTITIFYCLGLSNEKDYRPMTDWKTSTPKEQGMNPELFEDMFSYVEDEIQGIHSILVIKNGYIVGERYYSYYDKDLPHPLYSCTKSVTSTLVGIAIDQGYLDIDDYVLDFFPNRIFENIDEKKQRMTVKHLLQMKSGIEWDEWNTSYSDSTNLYRQMKRSTDWVKFVLDKPMAAEPGITFVYNSGVSHLLSAIIQQATNMTTFSFAEQNLFKPLVITPGTWTVSPNKVVCGGSDLCLTSRDMARFGYLFLNNGTCENKQLISPKWVEQSIYQHFELDLWDEPVHYGFQWWVLPDRYSYFSFFASGYRGQIILCIPELDLILVCTADSSRAHYNPIIADYLIPSITGKPGTSNAHSTPGFELPILLLGLITLKFMVNKKFNR